MREVTLPIVSLAKCLLKCKCTATTSHICKNQMVPPLRSALCRNDKKEKAAAEGPDEKELKKKEKQRLEKEKKELKERQEREKKEQKEREKKESEMKKKFKVSGTSQLLGGGGARKG